MRQRGRVACDRAVQHADAIAERERFVHVVRDEDDGLT